MIGEKDVFSCARSISLATMTRLLCTTASVTGSRLIPGVGLVTVREAESMRNVALRMQRDDEIAERVNLRAIARLDDRRRIELFDDGGPRDRIARSQSLAPQDRRVDPFAGEPDASANGGSIRLRAF